MPSSWVEIDLGALRHNYHQALARLGPRTSVVGVVKSDAYGHGMVPVARELVGCGATHLAVSKYWEARELRESGIGLPIVVLLGLEPQDVEEAIRSRVRPVIFRLDHARRISQAASRLGIVAPVHVKVDTGMGRLGVPIDRFHDFLKMFKALPGMALEGLLSHFAVADEADKSYSEIQIQNFRQTLEMAADMGFEILYAHISNSAGILDLPHAHFQLVRPGIMLYGSPPSMELSQPAKLLPVMMFKSRILQLKEVPAGHSIGYGRTHVTQGLARIATIPVGYDDGYSRLLSNRGSALVRGQRAPLVGRVSMNMITLDVTHILDAQEDDEVVLLGAQGNERISAEELADLSGTISYEVYCSIGRHRFKSFLNATPSSLAPQPTPDI